MGREDIKIARLLDFGPFSLDRFSFQHKLEFEGVSKFPPLEGDEGGGQQKKQQIISTAFRNGSGFFVLFSV